MPRHLRGNDRGTGVGAELDLRASAPRVRECLSCNSTAWTTTTSSNGCWSIASRRHRQDRYPAIVKATGRTMEEIKQQLRIWAGCPYAGFARCRARGASYRARRDGRASENRDYTVRLARGSNPRLRHFGRPIARCCQSQADKETRELSAKTSNRPAPSSMRSAIAAAACSRWLRRLSRVSESFSRLASWLKVMRMSDWLRQAGL